MSHVGASTTSSSDDETPSTPPRETLNLLFELSREAPNAQLRASEAIDSKIFQTFAAASILIGLASLRGVEPGKVPTAFVSAAVAAFLIVAAAAVWALWSRRFRVAIGPDQLWETYWSDDPDEIKHAFVTDIASGHVKNEQHLSNKHRAFRCTLVALVFEAAAIGGALIYSAL